jgi:fructoselysine-6-P-deglycase FrlB-like protein
MTYVAEEIASQPRCWAAAASMAKDITYSALPLPGERLAVVGCGTSYNMALAYARLREEAGQGITDAMPASELHPRREYDRFLFLSRSGTTTEVLDALHQVPVWVQKSAITADGNSPLAKEVGLTVVLDFASEQSIVQTRFATSLLVLLRAYMGDDVAPLVEDAKRAVDAPLPGGALAANRFTFLGRGWAVGLAQEAALKLREAAQVPTEAYPALELRHGPISILDAESAVWCLSAPPPGLAVDVAATGATFVVPQLAPLAELIKAQRLAVELASARHLDPDHPRHLSFSVLLGSSSAGADGDGDSAH